jgi:hypothetical protein
MPLASAWLAFRSRSDLASRRAVGDTRQLGYAGLFAWPENPGCPHIHVIKFHMWNQAAAGHVRHLAAPLLRGHLTKRNGLRICSLPRKTGISVMEPTVKAFPRMAFRDQRPLGRTHQHPLAPTARRRTGPDILLSAGRPGHSQSIFLLAYRQEIPTGEISYLPHVANGRWLVGASWVGPRCTI